MAEGHRQRVRDRLLSQRVQDVPEYVVLESYLHGIIPRKDMHALANRLIAEFGSFAQVVDAPLQELMRVDGVGEVVAKQIKLLPIYMRCYLQSKHAQVHVLCDSTMLGEYMKQFFIAETKEVAYVLCLNNVGKVMGCECLGEGSFSMVPIAVRKILSVALKYNATGVVLAHNHPNGVAMPSEEDILITRKLKSVLYESELALIDHLIMEDDDFISLRDSMIWDIWPEGPYRTVIGEE